MNIFSKLKLLWKVKEPAEHIIEEVSNVKAGWKTSEFWLTILSNLITIAGALQGVIDPKTAAVVLAALNGVYTTVRGIVKAKAGESL
jgi:hypothetical protein